MDGLFCGAVLVVGVGLMATVLRRPREPGRANVVQAHARAMGTYLPPGIVGTVSVDVPPPPETTFEDESHTLRLDAPPDSTE